MAKFFGATVIPAKPLSSRKVRGHILAALMATAKEGEKDLHDIVSTWNHPVYITKPKVRYAGGNASVWIRVNDRIFNFLDKGTKIRWALMSRDWVSKTRPGVYKSGTGHGYVRMRGKSMPFPRPGIKARNWTKRMAIELESKLIYRMNIAVLQGFRLQ
jgi:hypothetical protein